MGQKAIIVEKTKEARRANDKGPEELLIQTAHLVPKLLFLACCAGCFYVLLTQAKLDMPERAEPHLRKCLYKIQL